MDPPDGGTTHNHRRRWHLLVPDSVTIHTSIVRRCGGPKGPRVQRTLCAGGPFILTSDYYRFIVSPLVRSYKVYSSVAFSLTPIFILTFLNLLHQICPRFIRHSLNGTKILRIQSKIYIKGGAGKLENPKKSVFLYASLPSHCSRLALRQPWTKTI
jgi:hypothetical protein